TRASTVFPPSDELTGFDLFGLDGDHLVYVDARDPSCDALVPVNDPKARCHSTVRMIELATGEEHLLSTPGRDATRVRAGRGAAVWLETTDGSTCELMHARLGETSTVTAHGEVAADLNFETDGDWIVYQTSDEDDAYIAGLRADSGERLRLTPSWEQGW